jgi:chromosome segregation ATPase
VQRLTEREALEETIHKVKTQLVVAAYQRDLNAYQEAKPTVDVYKGRLDALSQTQAPLQAEKRETEESIGKLNNETQRIKDEYAGKCDMLGRVAEEMDQDQEATETIKGKISAAKRAKAEHQSKLKVYVLDSESTK